MVLFHIDNLKTNASATLSLEKNEEKIKASLSQSGRVFYSKESEDQMQLLSDVFKAFSFSMGDEKEASSITISKYRIPEKKGIEDATESLQITLALWNRPRGKAVVSFSFGKSYEVDAKETSQETLKSMTDKLIKENVSRNYLEYLMNVGKRFDEE